MAVRLPSPAVFVSDLRHFLDLPDDVPGPARRMAERLTSIVRAATAADAGAEWNSALECDRRPGRRPCAGHLAVIRTDIPASISWRCTTCGDEGVISGWERTPYDLRSGGPSAGSAATRRLTIPSTTAAVLRELRLIDLDLERTIFRAGSVTDGVILEIDEERLEDLVEHLAAEANHEPNRRRERRLDDAREVLSRALDQHRQQ